MPRFAVVYSGKQANHCAACHGQWENCCQWLNYVEQNVFRSRVESLGDWWIRQHSLRGCSNHIMCAGRLQHKRRGIFCNITHCFSTRLRSIFAAPYPAPFGRRSRGVYHQEVAWCCRRLSRMWPQAQHQRFFGGG